MARELQKIIVMGLGYIGLPTASMLATKGHTVVGVDVNESAVNTINSGRIHIIEPDLDILVRSAVNSGNLRASLVPEEGDTFIIAVPTPFAEGHAPDMSYVEAATRALALHLRHLVGVGRLVLETVFAQVTGQGKATGVTLNQNGRQMPAERVP